MKPRLKCLRLHSLRQLAGSGLRDVWRHGVVAGLDGGVGPGQQFVQGVISHHQGRGGGVVALVVEVGRHLGKHAAAAAEAGAQHAVLVEAAALRSNLVQDVVCEV